jgi:hypothetical protein
LIPNQAQTMQLLGSGLKAYLEAVEDAFGADIGCAQLHKNYGAFNEPETRAAALRALAAILKTVSGDPDPECRAPDSHNAACQCAAFLA